MAIDWIYIITFVVGLILGAFIGCISSAYLWKLQTNYRRRNIAKALKTDIGRVYQRVLPIDFQETVRQAFTPGGDNKPFILPFCEKNDLFYTIMTDIFNFDKPLSDKIFEFYKKVESAENYRPLLLAQKFEFHDEMYLCLNGIKILAEEIDPLLDNEIKRSVFLS
jgi:hypothetical protein